MRHKYSQDVALINEQMEALKKVRTNVFIPCSILV
jgi:hypothetical protein